jgi:hypothetical protein
LSSTTVADEYGLLGRSTGRGHERLEAPGMRFKQPDITGRDDVMSANPIAELLSRGVI